MGKGAWILMAREDIERWFPRLVEEGFQITSPEDSNYNCFAWAAGEAARRWDPDQTDGRFWPTGVTRSLDLQSFVEVYSRIGFEPCTDGKLEDGYEKVSIYLNASNEVEHAARQLSDGTWTSKLGDWEDIKHQTTEALEGRFYGRVAAFLRRQRA
jgi:hypothetical protein